jgi:hypothetical protein
VVEFWQVFWAMEMKMEMEIRRQPLGRALILAGSPTHSPRKEAWNSFLAMDFRSKSGNEIALNTM